MRILHVIQTVNPTTGGPVEGIRQIATAHHSEGHSLEIVSCDRPGDPFLSFPGVPVHPLHRCGFDRFFPLSLIVWLRRHHSHYDGVVVNGIWSFHLLATYLALRGSRTPLLVFPHGMLDPWFKRTYPLKHLKKWLVWPWAIHLPLRAADAVCFTCEQERLLARQSFWLYRCREQVVDYGSAGIPDPAFDHAAAFRAVHPAIAQRHCLLFLGRVAPKKGPDLLFHALATLQRQGLWHPQRHCLVLAGPVDGTYARRLQHLACRLHLNDSLHWTGMLQGDLKWGAFQTADAFILPSHQENFGIAVVEALSCSTPVLLTHAVNIAADIASANAGLVDQDTSEGITRLLSRWLALSPSQRQAMSRNARTIFEQRYEIGNASTSFIRIFEQAIANRRSSISA